jgi:phage terminase large subunit-like protein
MQRPTRFTPPLSEDFETDGDRLISLMELSWVTPETDKPIDLDEWQRWLFRHVLERYPSDHALYPGELRFRQILISMGRQNGKSVIGGGLALDALVFQRGDVASLASSREQAGIIYSRVKHVIDAAPWLRKRFKRTTETRGIAKLDGTGKYTVSPAREAAVQGLPFIRVLLDEGHLAKKGIWSAATKGTSAITDAQVIMVTTAGDQQSQTLIDLYVKAEQAIRGDESLERFGAFIWEAPANSKIDDPEAIKIANPAVASGRVPIERVLSDIATQPEHEVRRYTLNQFISGSMESWLPGDLFRAAAGEGLTEFKDIVLGVDVTRNFGHATITAARRVGDIYETELVASLVQPTEDRLAEAIADLYKRFPVQAIVVDDGWQHPLNRRLKNMGLPVWQLWTKERSSACMTVYAMFANGRVKHNNDPLLVAQNGLGMTKYSGESWLISRAESLGDIDALLATVWALYVAATNKQGGVQVF